MCAMHQYVRFYARRCSGMLGLMNYAAHFPGKTTLDSSCLGHISCRFLMATLPVWASEKLVAFNE